MSGYAFTYVCSVFKYGRFCLDLSMFLLVYTFRMYVCHVCDYICSVYDVMYDFRIFVYVGEFCVVMLCVYVCVCMYACNFVMHV